MITIFILIGCIIIINEAAQTLLLRTSVVVLPESGDMYVNKRHERIEKSLYGFSMAFMILAMTQFYSFRMYLFIVIACFFAYRSAMWHWVPGGRRTYLMGFIPCITFLTGAVVYRFLLT